MIAARICRSRGESDANASTRSPPAAPRQVWLFLRNQPYTKLHFGTPALYRLVRHPLYVGWFFAFWATPTMTYAHLLFAIATTAYILIAIQFEERDLIHEHGASYEAYRRNVPMLIPFTRSKAPANQGNPQSVES